MTPRELFLEELPKRLEKKGDSIAKVGAVYQFQITGDDGGSFWVDATISGGAVGEGEDPRATCTVTTSSKNFLDLVSGKLNGPAGFMTGKIKIQGNAMLAMQLGNILGM
jgi:putative sterol carrier protein